MHFMQYFFSIMNWHLHLENVHLIVWYADTKWKKKKKGNLQ